jgi:type VI secretion system secreted protein VgrG
MGLQAERNLRITSSAWEEKLLLDSFSGREAMSSLFEFELQLSSLDDAIAPKSMIGQPLGFSLHLSDDNERFFHGIVQRFSAGDVDERGYRHYRAHVVPALWKLTKRVDCRTFQGVTVGDVISKLLSEHGISGSTLSGIDSGALECCVQYMESDFDFMSRLLEDWGLYYFFKHEKTAHKLVIAGDTGSYGKCADVGHGDQIDRWEHSWTAISGKQAGRDYDYIAPTNNSEQGEKTKLASPLALMLDVYEYPLRADINTSDKAVNSSRQKKVLARIETQEAQHESISGSGNSPQFSPGHKFQLTHHDAKSETAKDWLVVQVEHEGNEPELSGGAHASAYSNTFTCAPADLVFRPAHRTARPKVFGLQTAMVVEEASTDPAKYGRVRVRFHWQRAAHAANLGWVRVAQSMAGKGFGAQFMPRVGHEVVVSFLDGDPDHPLIVGAVYNEDNREPYELSANVSQSGIKTQSYPDGAADQFNEILLEDKKDAEIFHIQAQKDMTRLVKNDDSTDVGNDQSITVKHDCIESVGHDRTLTIDNNQSDTVTKDKTMSIGEKLTESVGKTMALSVGENRTITVGKSLTEDVTENATYTVGKDSSTTVSGKMTLDVTKDVTITVAGKQSESITKELTIAAKKIQLTGEDEISIVSGSAKIVLKKSGDISIEGGKITVKGSSDVIVKGSKVAAN